MKKNYFLVLLLLTGHFIFANIKLPRLFSDNMVLQRNQPVTIWGWADANEKVTVQFIGQTNTCKAGKDGRWKIILGAAATGGPYDLTLQGKNFIRLKNILVGDVWVCSGQSNMEWIVQNSNNAASEIANASYPVIRQFEVPNTIAASPQEDLIDGEWKICSPETVGSFTAAGYFFAREIFLQTHIPIGLINASWGATNIETWTSREAFEKNNEFKSMIANMPTIDLEGLAKKKTAIIKQRINQLQGNEEQTEAIIDKWKELSYDDSHWPVMQAPKLWEEQSLPDFDGIVWYRRTIVAAADAAGKEAVIELAMIDDTDETYINGVKVGSTNTYNEKRKYTIPAGILKEGKNVIAVRVLDTGGGGGIWGEAADLKITIAGKVTSLAGNWQYQVAVVSSAAVAIGPNSYPTLLSNGMISPLIPFAIKGAIWYQGEANDHRAFQYRKAFPLMITDWRRRWGLGDFPFYFVQLASFNANNGNSEKGSGWAELREAQTMTLSLPNTGMAVTTDIGEAKDIHPRNKQDVGKRLAAIALNKNYNLANEYSGPVYQSMKIIGDTIVLSFTHLGSGLVAKNKYGYLQGFEIAGADKKFYFAKAFIKDNSVVVFNENVTRPAAVRFGWADDAGENNLFNKEGFPAGPFRTDNWPGITDNIQYQIGN